MESININKYSPAPDNKLNMGMVTFTLNRTIKKVLAIIFDFAMIKIQR